MTKDEALKLALDAFGEIAWSNETQWQRDRAKEAITAIKEALAQPEHGWTSERIAGMARLKDAQDKKLAQPEQEPVAYWNFNSGFSHCMIDQLNEAAKKNPAPLYTTPPQRTWVGLTEEEIDQGLLRSDYAFKTAEAWRAGVVFAMTKLKEKNCA